LGGLAIRYTFGFGGPLYPDRDKFLDLFPEKFIPVNHWGKILPKENTGGQTHRYLPPGEKVRQI